MFRFPALVFLGCLLWMDVAAAEGMNDLVVADAWLREAPPGASVNAAYLTIENHSEEEAILTGVSSEAFARVELHSMTMKDGMMRMRKLDQLAIPAGESLSLKPGGLHLMLHDAQKRPQAGEQISLQLHFSSGAVIELLVPVRKQAS